MRRLMLFLVVLLCLSSFYFWESFVPNQSLNAIASTWRQSENTSPGPSSTAEPEEESNGTPEQADDGANPDSADKDMRAAEPDDEEHSSVEADRGYQTIADEFFAVLEEDGGEEALELLFGYNPYMDRVSDQVAVLVNQYSSAEAVMGTYSGYELLIETNVSDRVVHQYYLVLYDRQPLRIDLTFYRAQDEWSFQNFVFSGDVLDEVKGMSNLALLGSEKVKFYPVPAEEPPSFAHRN